MSCGQPVDAAADATPSPTAPPPTQLDYRPQGYQPPPPSRELRLPWQPPSGQAPPGLPPEFHGAPLPPEPPMPDIAPESMGDTHRMLQPQGLFRPQGQFGGPSQYGGPDQYGGPGSYGPPPWPGGGAPGDTLPRGMGPGGPSGPLSRLPRPGRSGRRLIPLIIAVVLAAVVAGAIVLSSRGSGTNSAGTNSPGSTPTATASAPSTAAEKQAATALAALLPQSGTDRGDVIDAVTNVDGCKMLAKAATTFNTAANNRQTLLSKLATLPGRAALPAALVTDLTGAWQASVQVDSDLAKWANTASTHGCHKGNPKDPNLIASSGPDGQASTDKAAFVRLWNPIANRFGLSTYTAGQL